MSTARRAMSTPAAPLLALICWGEPLAAVALLEGCGPQSAPSSAARPSAARPSAAHPSESPPADSAADAEPADGVTLKPEEIEKMGITVTPAAATEHIAETTGLGMVAAHESIAQAVAEVTTAAAAERQSRAALARATRLAGTPGAMPAEAQETAQRQSTVDQAALLLAQQRLTANFGQRPPWKSDADSPILRALADGELKLVRVTFPLGSLGEGNPKSVRLARLNATNSAKGWTATALWDAPADSTVPGRSFFALLKGSDAGEGERLLAWIPTGSPESGVLVPATAAVISDGKYWCYVEYKPGSFVRTELDTSQPTADGYFVKQGIAPGAPIVTHSAGLLLAHETNPGTAAE